MSANQMPADGQCRCGHAWSLHGTYTHFAADGVEPGDHYCAICGQCTNRPAPPTRDLIAEKWDALREAVAAHPALTLWLQAVEADPDPRSQAITCAAMFVAAVGALEAAVDRPQALGRLLESLGQKSGGGRCA